MTIRFKNDIINRRRSDFRGGKCLSKKYINTKSKLKFECSEVHVWDAIPSDLIHKNSWCPECGGTKKLTLKKIQEIAKERSGKCLSKKYVNSFSKLTWKCSKAHVWEATPNAVQGGTWRPKCSQKERLTIELMQEIAKKKGGKCLSKKYISNKVKLKWECAEGHVWWAQPVSVKNLGQWCLQCYKLKPRKMSI